MDFKKYNSLENAYRQKFINHCHELGVNQWVALEKIHGANFSFICDENMVVTPAKRTSVLNKTEHGTYDFYGCNPIVEKYTPEIQSLANVIGGPIQVFGELYGEGVQKEVKYGKKDFIVFDIMLKDGIFLDWPLVKDLCEIFDIPYAPELGRGSLEEMLSLSPEFTSKLCEDNAEGIVIKPLVDNVLLGNGSRPIIKNKSEAFSEKKQKPAKKPQKMPEEVVDIFNDFCQYLNQNRLNNVLSKIGGDISQKDFGKIAGLLAQDAKAEFERDEYLIDPDYWKLISKAVGKEASSVVRKDWLNILDNRNEEKVA